MSVRHVAGLAAVLLLSSGVHAQEAYPNKPVKIVVGMPAGSFTDMTARWIGDELRATLGSSFVIENRPGAATNIAAGAVARAPGDGYTLLLATNANTMNPSLFKSLPFDVTKDFQPVAMIASASFLLVVDPSLPVANVQEFIAYAKARPGGVNIGATGRGTATHLAIEMFSQKAGVKVETIFYKSSVEALTDVLAGQVQATFAPMATAMPHVEAGKLKALATTAAQRSALALQIPTVAESGVPGYDAAMWTGMFAPAGTPRDVIDRLSNAVTKAVASSELQSKIKNSGGDPIVMGTRDFGAYVLRDVAKWSDTVKSSDIKPE